MSITLTANQDLSRAKPLKEGARPLSPAQSAAFARLLEAVQASALVLLEGEPGSGKTTIVERLVNQLGGIRIDGRDLVWATANSAHPCVEEQLHSLVENSLRDHDLVVIDDFHHVLHMTQGAGGYERPFFINVAIRALVDTARDAGKHIVLSGEETHGATALTARSLIVTLPPLEARDFGFFFALQLGPIAEKLDAERIYQYSPNLNVYQLSQLCRLVEQHGRTDEASVRELIDTRLLKTNMRLDEVERITFEDLKGFEGIIDRLTTFVLNPLRQDPRFANLGLKPKRGVLLYGPPGTGKTSIGRALAHQMKGKFFIIDGTIPPEPAGAFFGRIKQVFEAAKSATPSVIFIDDADVLFQSDRSTSLNRYLLTMLDGLESETAGKVAVIMTAMDPNHMPPPLLRSGRVELWLETKAPAAGTRAEIIADQVSTLPSQFQDYDVAHLVGLTDGFNAADMRRIIADVKALYASDVMDGRTAGIDSYFETAAANVRRNKDLLTLAEGGRFTFTSPAASGRDEAEKRQSRLRDESNQCSGE